MLRRAFASFLLLAATASVSSLSPRDVRADEPSKAELSQARAKFQQAIELEHAGNYAGALAVFRDVGTVRMTPQVRYHIATCEEKLGKLVAALGGYDLALSDSEGMQPDFIAEVQGAVDKLKARIPKILIQRGDGAEAAAIELDGVALGASSIGVETAVDPGPHTVSATAPGRAKFSQTVTVAESESQTLSVVLEALPSDAPVATTTSDGGVQKQPEGPKYGVLPYVLGGVGVVGLGMSGFFFVQNQSSVSDLEKSCPTHTNCNPADQDKFDSAKTQELLGWVSGGVGLASLGAGIALYILDHKKQPEESGVARTPRVTIVGSAPGAQTGLSVAGVF